MICATRRRERSRHGKTLSELKSGLQKYIRRGELEKALWCAGELVSFREAPETQAVKPIMTNVRHRLMIIFLEDVASIGLWRTFDILLGQLGPQLESAIVHEWVYRMVLSPKARICSHARAFATLMDNSAATDLARDLYPDLLEVHATILMANRPETEWNEALRSAIRNRDVSACIWAWKIQENGFPRTCPGGRKPVWQVFLAIEKAASLEVAALIPMARRWYKDLQNTKEAFLCWMFPLLAHIKGHNFVEPAELKLEASDLVNIEPMELDDYVYDIHVSGPRKGGLMRFAMEGSRVENESDIVDQYWKAFYEDRKLIADGVAPRGPPETRTMPNPAPATDPPPNTPLKVIMAGADLSPMILPATPLNDKPLSIFDLCEVLGIEEADLQFETKTAPEDVAPEPLEERLSVLLKETDFDFDVRAQITTSRGKTDVYFAHLGDTELVVKGPMSRLAVERACEMCEWKLRNGLPSVKQHLVEVYPDRWPEGVPLGLRNKTDRDQSAAFLVSESLIPGPLPRRDHGPTKMWPVTEVVDWDQLGEHRWAPLKHWNAYTIRERTDYTLALLARYVMGISDLADRNFLRAQGNGVSRLYSLDEDGRSEKPVNLAGELRKKKADMVRVHLMALWDSIRAEVAAWTEVSSLTRWETVLDHDKALALFE